MSRIRAHFYILERLICGQNNDIHSKSLCYTVLRLLMYYHNALSECLYGTQQNMLEDRMTARDGRTDRVRCVLQPNCKGPHNGNRLN